MKILQISTHSTLAPRYGGQIRSHHIGKQLESAGFDVSRLAVMWRTPEEPVDPREPIVDVGLSPFWSSSTFENVRPWGPYIGEYYLPDAVCASQVLMTEFLKHVDTASPAVILLEHPWTWRLIRDLPGVRSGSIRVIYSSHNVESTLRHRMIQDAGVEVPRSSLDALEAMEQNLVRSAWATVACTELDGAVFRSWGGSRVTIANNGTVVKRRDHLRNTFPAPLSPEHRFDLFIGSQYPPNTNGFLKYVLPSLSRLKPNQRIVVAGSVCEAIDARIAASPLESCLDRRLVMLGFVDDLTLDALIANASALLLPIEYGGGSHLKTAEALASGQPIVGTTASFRGFSEYTSLSRVTLADTPERFEIAIHDSLSTPGLSVADTSVPGAVQWSSTLSPLTRLLSASECDGADNTETVPA
jgi:glycosyltransferase involved in cell wall biosynthesis